jgi:hypothetical protein
LGAVSFSFAGYNPAIGFFVPIIDNAAFCTCCSLAWRIDQRDSGDHYGDEHQHVHADQELSCAQMGMERSWRSACRRASDR